MLGGLFLGAALILLAAAAIWAIIAYGAFWQHLGDFAT